MFLTVLLIQRNLSHAERNEFWIDRRVVTRLQDSATAHAPHRGVVVLGTKLLQAAEGGDECG